MGILFSTIRYYVKYIIKRIRYPYLRRNYHLSIGRNVDIDKQCVFEGYNLIGRGCILSSVAMGKLSYLGYDCVLEKCKIGRFSSIGPGLRIASGNHPTSGFVSTHPTLFTNRTYCGIGYCNETQFEELSYTDESKKWFVEIGNDVWIGQNVTILNGCTIGDGAIIAAGAVVTKNVDAYSIVGGVPAKQIRSRFGEEDIEFLRNLQWWKKDDMWLKENASSFSNILLLKETVRKKSN